MAFSFGGMNRPRFGATTTTASTGLFGSVPSTAPIPGFGFSANPAQAPSLGFGATPSTSSGFGFGTGATATPAFGAPTAAGITPFGTSAQGTGFGTGFGTPAASGFGTGLGAGTTGGFGTGLGAGTAGAFGTGLGMGATGAFGTGLGTGTTAGFGTGLGTGTTGGFGTGLGAGTTGGFGTGLGAGTTSGFGTGLGAGTVGGFGTGLGGSTGGFGTGLGGMTNTFGTGLGGTSGAFGTGLAGNTGGFGTGLGTGANTGFGTGLGTCFGSGLGLGGAAAGPMFGTGLGLAAKPGVAAATASAAFQQCVNAPVIFNDERDVVIAKWNQLQACWGTGKGYYGSQPGQCVDFTSDNPYSFFKAVGYSCMLSTKNEDGMVSLIFARKQSEVCDNQQQIVDTLHRILGSRPNIMVCVEAVKPISDDRTEMVIYIQDRQATGHTNRITASDASQFLNQDAVRNQLVAQLCISNVFAKVTMTPDQLKIYLSSPPAGIDVRIWEQAKLDNPNPDKLIPVPMVGFTELYSRLKHNEQEGHLHQLAQDMIASEITRLHNNLTNMIAKTEQAKRKELDLSHRLLKVIVKQEIYRKHGYAIQVDEEQLRVQLEAIVAELNSPTQLKGRLNELMSQMRMQNLTCTPSRVEGACQIDGNVQDEIRQHLKRQQEGIQHLIGVIKEDLSDLKLIENGLNEGSKSQFHR